MLQEGGRNFGTPEQYINAVRQAYAGQAGARFGTRAPHILEVECAYDFRAFIEDYRNEDFGGFGHTTQMQVDKITGEIVWGRKGSEVHFLHFYNFEGAYGNGIMIRSAYIYILAG